MTDNENNILTDIIETIIFEYNLGYEPSHEQALYRAIEIIKDNKLDEKWTDEIVEKRINELQKLLEKETNVYETHHVTGTIIDTEA